MGKLLPAGAPTAKKQDVLPAEKDQDSEALRCAIQRRISDDEIHMTMRDRLFIIVLTSMIFGFVFVSLLLSPYFVVPQNSFNHTLAAKAFLHEDVKSIVFGPDQFERQLYSDKNDIIWTRREEIYEAKRRQIFLLTTTILREQYLVKAENFEVYQFPRKDDAKENFHICMAMWCKGVIPPEAEIIHVRSVNISGLIEVGTQNSSGLLMFFRTLDSHAIDFRNDACDPNWNRTTQSLSPVVIRATWGFFYTVTSTGTVPSRLATDGHANEGVCLQLDGMQRKNRNIVKR